jgi:hypothetical protein
MAMTAIAAASADSTRFYAGLPVHTLPVSELLADTTRFADVPDDWQVILTDVRQSTQAWNDGRHQVVNLTATGSIIAALNLAQRAGVALPFFFGGDGATLIAPAGLAESIERALLVHRDNTRINFDLDLRVGRVAVAELRARGHRLKLARAEIGPGFIIPVTLGSGLLEAERIVKGEGTAAPPAAQDASVDLNGMECRWDSIRPPQDAQEVVCLLVVVRTLERQAGILSDVLRLIDALYGPLAKRTPIARQRLKLKATFAKVAVEMRAKLGRFDLAYLVGKWFYTVIGRLYFTFSSAGDHYLDRLVQLSDTLMIDGRINTIISGTPAQREALITALRRFEDKGEIIFGLQICSASVMSCYVRDRVDAHIHFVDGLGGGYTQAAAMLKKKMANLAANGVPA